MKNFLKIALLVVAVLIAVKFLPLLFGIGCLLALAVAALLTAGVSAIFGCFIAAIVIAAVLSPLWIPVLALIGLIALIKRSGRAPRAAGS